MGALLTPTPGSPAAQGWRMPAEWAPQAGTWLSWPHNEETWPFDLPLVEQAWVAMAAALAPHQHVHINVQDDERAAHVQALLKAHGGIAPAAVTLHRIPTNDNWVRDHGPIFVRHPQKGVAVTDWGYNAWGGKYPPWEEDNEVPRRVAEALGLERFDGGMVLEGGGIEVNGTGLLLTTQSCLLAPTRNPNMTRAAIEQRLCDVLGITKVAWLPGGDVQGDDTDGHVDNLARLTPGGAVLVAHTDDKDDVNYGVLQENLEACRALTDERGRPLDVVPLPQPPPVMIRGQRFPASHANYLIANGVVLVPVYGGDAQDAALALIAKAFADRRVVPIDARAMIWGQGAVHCCTQQQPG